MKRRRFLARLTYHTVQLKIPMVRLSPQEDIRILVPLSIHPYTRSWTLYISLTLRHSYDPEYPI
jgi:hypothetical protein